MQIGQVIRIPNQDGILYTVKTGDTLESIAETYKTTAVRISTVNELFSDTLTANASLFIPGGKMDWVNRQEINGDLFIWPSAGYITSPYGFRRSPFDGTRQFHSGMDIGAPLGTPIRAAMAGRVSQVGYDNILGTYVIITHHSGYRTLYAHMSRARVNAGAYVGTGQRIGDVGVSGLTTGPHLHFTVFKNGVTVNPRSLMR
jgi:murein DD-endopeptidase MepM/ murein hydrolase activator NlpD